VGPRPWGVYPRVYGATSIAIGYGIQSAGLSPCVRGYRHLNDLLKGHPGSIPLCTEQPWGRGSGRCESEVYPRVCGVTVPSSTSCRHQ
jgi:hypothetical protein